MTTEKLTLDICFKYPNARIKHNSARTESCESISSFLNGLHKRNLSECKLILIALSSLTDEEKDILNFIDCQIKVIHSYDVLYRLNWIRVSERQKDLIDKFREWNIDIDGLQERGIAVYE